MIGNKFSLVIVVFASFMLSGCFGQVKKLTERLEQAEHRIERLEEIINSMAEGRVVSEDAPEERRETVSRMFGRNS